MPPYCMIAVCFEQKFYTAVIKPFEILKYKWEIWMRSNEEVKQNS